MLNFPSQIASRLQRAAETLRLLAGMDSSSIARPFLTDANGVLQVAITAWQKSVYWVWGNDVSVVSNSNARWYNLTGRTLTFTKVHISVNTAPTGAAIIIDIHKNGSSIFTAGNRPQIAISAFSGESVTFNTLTIADGEYLSFDIDQVGSTIAGSDLAIQVLMQ